MGRSSAGTDSELILRFTRYGDESAFGEVVRRYTDMAHSASMRMLADDTARAERAVRAAFTLLRREAAELPEGVVVAAWLHSAVCSACRKLRRIDSRRLEPASVGA